MARLAIRLQVFISSPSDVQPERELVESVVHELAREMATKDLLLHVYRYEIDAVPGSGRPLDAVHAELAASELVIAILGKGIGSPARVDGMETGTQEEIRFATSQVKAGGTDDVFFYYRADAGSAQPVATIQTYVDQVIAGRDQGVRAYQALADLRATVTRDLRRWLSDWEQIPTICRAAFMSSDLAQEQRETAAENRLDQIRYYLDLERAQADIEAWGARCIRVYQERGPDGYEVVRGPATLGQLTIPDEGGARLAHPEVFYFLCATGLLVAIVEGNHQAVEAIPYVNPIHQYLAALAEHDPRRAKLVATLLDWLQRRTLRPTARNFAAYVLGMIGAHEAEEALANALTHDKGQDVKTYCITSLGKLRSRRYLRLLRDEYLKPETPESRRDLIAKAVCRIIGVGQFEL